MNLVYLDIETTGLDPQKHEILEICLARTTTPDSPPLLSSDPGSPDIPPIYERYLLGLDLYWRRVAPQNLETAEMEALEVNGFTPEAWLGAKPLYEWLPDIASWIEGRIVCGQNVAFDISFLVAAFQRQGIRVPRIRTLDTMTLSLEHLVSTKIQTAASLNATCSTLGIPNVGAHGALVDVLRARAVCDKLLRANAWQRLGWRIRRNWKDGKKTKTIGMEAKSAPKASE